MEPMLSITIIMEDGEGGGSMAVVDDLEAELHVELGEFRVVVAVEAVAAEAVAAVEAVAGAGN